VHGSVTGRPSDIRGASSQVTIDSIASTWLRKGAARQADGAAEQQLSARLVRLRAPALPYSSH
jgi:hypothetical protein